jgi:O-antigen/teichoic acid export membrane protein
MADRRLAMMRLVHGPSSLRSLPFGSASAGVVSNGIGLLITVLIQVVSVPAYLTTFGATVYGEWLVLSAIPLYLSLGDLGFASVAATQATREFAIGEVARARCTMRSAWLAVTCLSVVLFGLAGLLLGLVPIGLLPIHAIPSSDARTILLLLVGYMLTTVQSSFVEGCFRAGGRFPLGTVMASFLRLAEFVAAVLTALWTHSPVAAALALLGVRALGQVAYALLLRRHVPLLTLGYQTANLPRVRELAVPALTYLSFPLGNALAAQGMVVVTAAELGAGAVVTLNALRVMAMLLRHIANVAHVGVFPEITAALARSEGDRARRLVNNSLAASLLAAGICGVVLAAGGDTILHIWTGGRIQASLALILAMAATILADLPWLAWSMFLLARNEHQLLGVLYAGSCLLAVVTAKLLLSRLGLLAVPLALLLTDVVLYVPAYRGARRVQRLAQPRRSLCWTDSC